MADAMNTVEYVPLTMPTSIVNANPRSGFAAEEIRRQHGGERHPRGDERARQCLVHAEIDDRRERNCRASPWRSRAPDRRSTIVSFTE